MTVLLWIGGIWLAVSVIVTPLIGRAIKNRLDNWYE